MLLEENSYQALLEEQVLSALNIGANSFAEICRACKGAFPSEVLDVIQRLEINLRFFDSPIARQIHNIFALGELWAEPSPTDFEWRFTQETADNIARLALSFGQKLLCLGTPTVFHSLITKGANTYLIDRNPFIVSAFPQVSADKVIVKDISEILEVGAFRGFDVIVMDPPWYLAHTEYWLKTASNLANQNGIIIFPLFPELVRPSAISERTFLLKITEELGTLNISDGTISYLTPLFEQETLFALGIGPMATWRVADLVTLKLKPTRNVQAALPPREDQWEHFRLGTQIVAIKKVDDGEEISAEAPSSDGYFLLRSVSARNPIRSVIGFWTSRNRVAMITGSKRITQFLRALEKGCGTREAIATVTSSPKECDALTLLTALIGW